MSKFHSSVSRRDFMKGLGLVGVGSAALTAPMFHDLDELASSENAINKRAWWVKEVDEPVAEIDWSRMQRFDQRQCAESARTNAQYTSVDEWRALVTVQGAAKTAERNGKKNFTLRDQSLNSAATYFFSGFTFIASTLLGPTAGQPTPETRGLPKWTGTPEEASRMMKAAARFYGAGQIGACHLGEDEKKLVFTYMKAGSTTKGTSLDMTYVNTWPPPLETGPKVEFENVAVGYETAEKKVLPSNVDLYDVGVMIPMAKDAWRTSTPSGSGVSGAANISRYRMWTCSVQPCLQAFVRGLGYHGYGYPYPDMSGGLLPSEASAVLGGMSEPSRSSEIINHPEYGSTGGYYSLLVDLPMAHDKPIDAGMFRFCHTCHKCANNCPSGSISQDDEPSWELPQYKIANINQQAGKKLFWTNCHTCMKYRALEPCTICRPVCTFNTNTAAIHEYVKGTLSTTPMFNSLLWKADTWFGYGLHDSEEWWDKSLPIWGTDSTTMAYDGGYR